MADPYAAFKDTDDPYAQFSDAPAQGAPKKPVKSFDVVGGQIVPTGSPEAKAALFDYPGRTTALYARSAAEGVGNALAAPHDLGVWLRNQLGRASNAAFNTHFQPEQTWGSGFSQALTQAGAPTAQTEGEKTGTAVTRGVTGALTGGGLMGTANPSLTTGANMGRTAISGATSAGAGEAARRSGLGPISQFIASVLGGSVPFLGSTFSRAAPAGPEASEGVAEQSVSAAPEATATGGGSSFGSVGESNGALTPAQQRAADAGQKLGMRMTPGTLSGNKSLQQLEAKLESQPMTSGPFFALKDANQKILNRVTAGAIGENVDSLDAVALGRAADRLGDVFDSVRTPDRIVLSDPQATSRVLDAIDTDAEGLLPNNGSIRDNPLVKNLETLSQQGSINGEQLGSLSSKLGRAAWKQMSGPSGDRDLGRALYAVKDHVDDLVQSSLTPEESAAFAQARSQYRNLMLITSRTGIVNPSSGNVSGVALASRLQQADKTGFLYGKNQSDWYNAARFAQAFKPIVGDSGTATRSMITSPMQLVTRAPINIASRLYLRNPAATANVAANAGRYTASGAGLFNPLVIPAAAGGLMARDQ